MNKPEALRLADELDAVPETGADPDLIQESAAELRRLHDESEMRAAAYSSACGELRKAEAQCDALLEALREAQACFITQDITRQEYERLYPDAEEEVK